MSNAKRDHSEFRHTAAVSHVPLRAKPGSTTLRPARTPAVARRASAAWTYGAAPGSDPYNAVGARAAPVRGQRA
jgi:hypothetical protein